MHKVATLKVLNLNPGNKLIVNLTMSTCSILMREIRERLIVTEGKKSKDGRREGAGWITIPHLIYSYNTPINVDFIHVVTLNLVANVIVTYHPYFDTALYLKCVSKEHEDKREDIIITTN